MAVDQLEEDSISIPDICGPSWWAMIHAWAESIRDAGCASCGEFAVKAVSALHDLVNIHLEKPLHDAPNFLEIADHYLEGVRQIQAHHPELVDAKMSQALALPVTISGKCSGDTELCQFRVKATKVTEAVTGAISTLPDVVDEVRRRALEAERTLVPGSGQTFAFGSLSGTRYDFRLQLVESSVLIVSNDPFTFVANPDFPRELQPRLRDRASLRLQVETLAASLNADLLLTDFHSLDRGAPIIGPDMAVESGNGRAMGILRAVQDHKDVYGDYRQEMSDRAPEFGVTADEVSALESPVLVRLRVTDVDRVEFVQEANLSAAVSSSSVENALTDAQFITPTLLSSLSVTEGQTIDEALRATRNNPFTSAFLAALPKQEQAKLVDADGRLNQDGVRRMTMAIFARSFPGDSGLRLAEHFFESTDANVKNVFVGMLQGLGPLVQAESLTESGSRDPELAIGEDIAKAVSAFSNIKATPGMTVDSFLAQGQLFERSLTPFQERVLKAIDNRSRSSRLIGELLRSYSNIVIAQPPPAQATLIDIDRISKEQAWEQAESASVEPTPATLFQQVTQRAPGLSHQHADLPGPVTLSAGAASPPDDFILTERSSGPGLSGIIPSEFAHLKVQTRLVRSRAFDPEKSPQITKPEDLQPLVRLMREADREFLLAIFADTKNRVIAMMEVNVGQRAATLVDFDAILRAGILSGAGNVFLAHNHPSGDPTPSPEDRKLFELATSQCRLLDLEFVEMLIVGRTQDFSMSGNMALPAPVGPMGQGEPEIRISGKCEGDVDGSCEFRVKKAEKTVKVQGIQAAIDAAMDIIEQSRSSGTPSATGGGPAEVKPLTVELEGGTFTFAPETIIDMAKTANQTGKRERGFALCLGKDGMIEGGLRCLGGNCSLRINDCLGRKQVGVFHTHPSDNPDDPKKDSALQRTFSTTDLLRISRHRGTIECLGGATSKFITCAVAKPDARAVTAPNRMYPYIHPESPDALRDLVKSIRRTPGGKVSSAQWFQPQVGKQFDFVEFEKVGAFPTAEAQMCQEDGLSEFAMALDVGGEGEFISERIADTDDFDQGSIRTIEKGEHRIRIGCPRGNWDGARCEVGTKAQSVLHPRAEESELISEAMSKGIPVIGEPIMEALDHIINTALEEVTI